MSDKKMHHNEINLDAPLVRQLLTAQFPQWANLSIKSVHSDGTDNAIYQLGTDMCVRLPRIPRAAMDIEKEQRWLPQLAPLLPLAIPVPLGKGNPDTHYPWHWSVYCWLKGKNAVLDSIADSPDAANDLAR